MSDNILRYQLAVMEDSEVQETCFRLANRVNPIQSQIR